MKVDADGFRRRRPNENRFASAAGRIARKNSRRWKTCRACLMNGSALSINWADANLPAILEAWYPGEEGGTAVAGAIAGDFSPAGRLPVTFYKSVDQLPPFEDYSMAKRTYRYFDGEPLYPFGYGLSFTSFAYKNVHVDHAKISSEGFGEHFRRSNQHRSHAGDEVVQLVPNASGSCRSTAARDERFPARPSGPKAKRRPVSFTLSHRDLSIVDPDGKHRVVPGNSRSLARRRATGKRSGGAETAGIQTQFAITGAWTLPD